VRVAARLRDGQVEGRFLTRVASLKFRLQLLDAANELVVEALLMPEFILDPFELRRLSFVPLVLNIDDPLLVVAKNLLPVREFRQ
jgi:hypothetical protein